MKIIHTLAVLAASAAAMPAAAVTFDAYASFNGTNGNNGFVYGYTDGVGSSTPFDVTRTGANCPLAGGICLSSSVVGDFLLASKGGSYSTVAPAGNRLVLHPGNGSGQAVYVAFVAPAAGRYAATLGLESIGTDTQTGVGYTFFSFIGGTTTFSPRQTLSTFGENISGTGTVALGANDAVGVIIDPNGNYFGDSTALSFRLAVPEPATWGMMVLGFGLVGAGMRSRRRATAAA